MAGVYTLDSPQLADALAAHRLGRDPHVLIEADATLIGRLPAAAGPAITFRVRLENDEDAQPPWERSEGHGRVSDWKVREQKRPGERPMGNVQRDGSDRFYNWAEAMQRAQQEDWRPHGLTDEQAATMSKGQIAQQAVQEDFERMRDWCHGEWRYLGVIVEVAEPAAFRHNPRVIDDDFEASVWGVESDWFEGIVDPVRALIAELLHTIDDYQVCPHCEGTGRLRQLGLSITKEVANGRQ